MDDEDDNNANAHVGALPDGHFVNGNEISFCCRQDSLANIPILLPIDKPFYLMRYTGLCQEVLGMTVSDEFIYYDNEDNRNANNCTGAHPFVEGGCRTGDMKIHYCYYDRANHNSSPISISGIIG
ncbi:uncharacterized protein LOC134259422 [Saccostrea cucullata]|uniref:uncharacterized protein LOC134259422 n=1 Tax=Saccostrea cuccullata TaxID=36930 RepID=UPI002ED3A581